MRPPERPKLMQALEEAKARVAAMTPAELEVMLAAQRASFVRSAMLWPKAKFKMINGVKTYESYSDYCAD